MSHLERLLVEYYEWRDHVVKCNVRVGRLAHGGHEMELDVVAYDPTSGAITHLEPSLDADTWAKREERFRKKFEAGKKYILTDLFRWLPPTTKIVQKAIFPSAGDNRRSLAGAQVQTVDEVIAEIKHEVCCKGLACRAAISERYPLLRTIQLVTCGYYRVVEHVPAGATDTAADDVTTPPGAV